MTPLLMQSLPNSGSTWLGALIAEHTPGCRYAMEFFNPCRNPKYERVLVRQFGCELVSCYRNIAKGDDGGFIDDDIASTWGRENYTFTKEVFSPLKLEAFCRHFRCFVLLRSEDQSFPPKRGRIWCFYEHAWYALKDAGFSLLSGDGYEQRAREAHAVLSRRIAADATWLGVPVIDYDSLFGPEEEVAQVMRAAIGDLVTDGLISAIVSSREVAVREDSAEAWSAFSRANGKPHPRTDLSAAAG